MRNTFVVLVIILCSVLITQALDVSETKDLARRTAAQARDAASTLEERQEALKELTEAVRLYLISGENVEAARVLNRAGRLQLKLNKLDDALANHHQALALLKQTPSVEVEVDNLNGLAAVYLREQDENKIKDVLDGALSLSQRSGYERGEAEALLTLSDIQNYKNHVTALATAQTALDIWRRIDDRIGLANCYAKIGQYYMAQNILPEARQNYETSLQIWRELNDVSEQAGVLINFGFIEYRKGEWDNSIAYLTQAQGLIDAEAEPEKMGQVAAGMAEAFNENGLPELGLPYFESALSYYRITQDPHLVAIGLLGVGFTHYLLGNYAKAEQYCNEVLASAKADRLEAARSHRFLGTIYLATRKYNAALAHFQDALPIYLHAENPKEAAQIQGLMGQVYQQQGQLERAHGLYQQARTTFIKLSDRLNLAAIDFALGRLKLSQDNLKVAEDYLRQSMDATENIRRLSNSRDLTTAFSATVHDRYETYIDCLMRESRTDASRRLEKVAFETSELARGRSLADLLRATQTSPTPGGDPQLAQREKSLRLRLRARENYKIVLLSKPHQKEELTSLEKELEGLNSDYERVSALIRAQDPGFAELTQPTGWTLQEIQQRVVADDQTVLLEYLLGAERSYLWAVTSDNITSYELPAEGVINDLAAKTHKLLATRPDEDSQKKLGQATAELSQIILAPVVSQLGKHRIIVVADGALNYIPFQSLPVPSDHTLLIANHEITNAPSASILGQLHVEVSRRNAPPRILAAFGDPIFQSNFKSRNDQGIEPQFSPDQESKSEPLLLAQRDIETEGTSIKPASIQPLFYAQRELANLRTIAGAETLLATGFDATREQLKEANLTQFAILHLATHGYFDPKRPEKSGIVLSMINREGQPQNGFFGLEDIYNLDAPVDLVVLSACSTGLGKDVRGEGLIGLTRGFMYAGAASVVASLWKVEDEVTAELMKRFYSNMLQHGMKPGDALRAAQNSIRQEPEWSAPYYWAAFTLQGDSRIETKLHPAAESKWVVMIVGIALLGLLAALYVGYRRMRAALEDAGYQSVNK
jgi:CHAT domain-containing protein